MNDQKKRKRNDFAIQNPIPTISFTIPPLNQKELKSIVIEILSKEVFKPPFDSFTLFRYIKSGYRNVDYSTYVLSKLKINDVIRELSEYDIIQNEEMIINLKLCYYVKSIDYDKLKSITQEDSEICQDFEKYSEKAKIISYNCINEANCSYDKDNILNTNYVYDNSHMVSSGFLNSKKNRDSKDDLEKIKTKKNEHEDNEAQNNLVYSLLFAETAKEKMKSTNTTYTSALEKMQTKYASSLRPFCSYGTQQECQKKTKGNCSYVHFMAIIEPHTDVTLGDCYYLDTCRHMEICKFVNYKIEESEMIPSNRKELILSGDEIVLDSQWVNCDIRYFDYTILGKFDVIMADPPWDIHMDLPYGTLSDEEMKNLKVGELQQDGMIFLWVTGRATELARECLELWGYERKEELVWIKTNQLQRLIRTGRTGHWLNHSKEHCLIGIKGNPQIFRNIDSDVLVSEVRETSRKPDEIYELIERMRPGGRKLELFARPHNRRKGWISLGNQLPGVYFVEPELTERFNSIYPETKLTKEVMEKNKESSITKKTGL